MIDKGALAVIRKMSKDEIDALDRQFWLWGQAQIGRLVMELKSKQVDAVQKTKGAK
jgi:hypothetical protein